MPRNKPTYTVIDAGSKQQKQNNRIVGTKLVFHHGELVNISQSEAVEASGVSIVPIILFMYLVK